LKEALGLCHRYRFIGFSFERYLRNDATGHLGFPEGWYSKRITQNSSHWP